MRHIDAKRAFSNAKLKETIYMKQPPGFEEKGKGDLVCLLKKSIYGLKQAAKSRNDAVHTVLIDADFQQSRADQCLYLRKYGSDWAFLLIYVDDTTIAIKVLIL